MIRKHILDITDIDIYQSVNFTTTRDATNCSLYALPACGVLVSASQGSRNDAF